MLYNSEKRHTQDIVVSDMKGVRMTVRCYAWFLAPGAGLNPPNDNRKRGQRTRASSRYKSNLPCRFKAPRDPRTGKCDWIKHRPRRNPGR